MIGYIAVKIGRAPLAWTLTKVHAANRRMETRIIIIFAPLD
jgi:hypothetical protein